MSQGAFQPSPQDADPLATARALRARGDLGGAEAAIREALARRPDDPEALLELAAILADLDRFDAALRVIDRVAAARGGAGDAGDVEAPDVADDAAGDLEERTERLRADVLGRSGRIEAAIATLRALVARRPLSREAWLDLSLGLVAGADPDAADRVLGEALERLPSDPELWAARGNVAAARGRPQDAVLYLTRALTRADETLPPDRRVLLKTNLASALDMAGETDKALATWRSIIVEHEDASAAYLQLGIALWRKERYAEAVAVLDDAVARWPAEHHGYYYLADSRRMLGDRAEAERVFERAIARWPECPECLFGLAQVRHESGRPEEAALLLRHVMALRPGDPDTIGLFADARFAIGEHEEARRLFEMAMALAPREVRHVYNFAIREREAGRLERATALFDRALELAPHLDRALYFGAVCRIERGLRREALDYLVRFVRAAPPSAPIVRADPRFDPLKAEDAYRDLVGGSALDFAAPQAARSLLERLLDGLPRGESDAPAGGRPLGEAVDEALAAAARAKERRGPVRPPPRFYFETEVKGAACLIAERDALAPPETSRRVVAVLVRLPDGTFRVVAVLVRLPDGTFRVEAA